MKMYDGGLVIIISVLVTAFIIGIVSNQFLGPDNAIEEIAEEIIKEETGLTIDLTPTPPDKR